MMKHNVNLSMLTLCVLLLSLTHGRSTAEAEEAEHESERIPRVAAQSKRSELPTVSVNEVLGQAPFAPVTMKEVVKYGEVPYYAFRFTTPKAMGTFVWGFNYHADPDIFYMGVLPATGSRLKNPGQSSITLKSALEGVGKKDEMILFERYDKGALKPGTEYIICIGRTRTDPVLHAVLLNMFQGKIPDLYEDVFPGLKQ